MFYICSPHVDFGTVLNGTDNQVMQFERIAFARNPSNTVDDECWEAGQCRQPFLQLNKLGNPLLDDTFPEILEFLDNFEMTSADVNEILLYEHADARNDTFFMEKWFVCIPICVLYSSFFLCWLQGRNSKEKKKKQKNLDNNSQRSPKHQNWNNLEINK